jgi:hypothetical protein
MSSGPPRYFDIVAGLFMIGMGVMVLLYFGLGGLFVALSALLGSSPVPPSSSAAGHIGVIAGGLAIFGFAVVCIWRGVESLVQKPEAAKAPETRPGYRLGHIWGRVWARLRRSAGSR